ncbi:hypothetical protein [Geminocystis sp.]|uniref:hypothetical protein n=1 Tax=Geminocystis sp. TaxID=2664100 RepID=UPI00359328AD
MNFKNLQYLTVATLGLFLGANTIKPVQAFEINPQTTESSSSELLLSQLRGHNTYMGQPQIEWGDSMLGRVIGRSGGIMFIRAEDGVVFHANGGFCPGSDVLVGKADNGQYYLVGQAESQWISRLQSKYGYKRLDASAGALNERTAAIWASMNSSTTTREIPARPVMQSAPTYTPQPEVQEYNQPIRGLW